MKFNIKKRIKDVGKKGERISQRIVNKERELVDKYLTGKDKYFRKKMIGWKEVIKMPQLKFRDLSKRKNFMSDKFKIVAKRTKRGTTYFAVATAPSGSKSWRIVSKDFAMKYK